MLKESAQRVSEALKAKGFDGEIVELADSTRTAEEAAHAVGCAVGQIAKSIVFRGVASAKPILVIASGRHRINVARIEAWLGEPVGKADAHFVREQTGYVIGGVPPLAHRTAITTVLDRSLWDYDVIWAAAGHPHAVFQLTPDTLRLLTGGHALDIE